MSAVVTDAPESSVDTADAPMLCRRPSSGSRNYLYFCLDRKTSCQQVLQLSAAQTRKVAASCASEPYPNIRRATRACTLDACGARAWCVTFVTFQGYAMHAEGFRKLSLLLSTRLGPTSVHSLNYLLVQYLGKGTEVHIVCLNHSW